MTAVEFCSRKLRLKWGDTCGRVRDDLTAMLFKDERDIHILFWTFGVKDYKKHIMCVIA
jgi:hypothetical protein